MGQRINNEKGEVLGYFLTEAEYIKTQYAMLHRELDPADLCGEGVGGRPVVWLEGPTECIDAAPVDD